MGTLSWSRDPQRGSRGNAVLDGAPNQIKINGEILVKGDVL